MVQGFLCLMLAVAACWPAAAMAQSLSGRGLDFEVDGRPLNQEPPPGRDAGIVDPQGFLNRAPDVRERIQRTMARLQDDHGFRIILMIEPVFLDTNVFHQAAAFFRKAGCHAATGW